MADTLSNAAIALRGEYTLGGSPASPSLEAGLFVSDTAISCTTVIGDLTECTAPGYARIALSYGAWTGPVVTSCVSVWSHAAVTFALTGPGAPGQTIYGHFIIDTVSGDLMWARNWGAPFALPSGSSVVTLTPTWTDQQC